MAKAPRKPTTIIAQRAFEQAQQAFAEGLPFENPYNFDLPHQKDAAFAWRRGYTFAQLDRDLAEGVGVTPIYSVFPAIATCEDAQVAYDKRDLRWREYKARGRSPYDVRNEYDVLPWSLESLAGSTWINLHTRTICTVTHFDINTWSQREPAFNSEVGAHSDYVHCTIHGPGFWCSSKRYVIEHWLRYDTLPPEVQAAWCGWEREQMLRSAPRQARTRTTTLQRSDAAIADNQLTFEL